MQSVFLSLCLMVFIWSEAGLASDIPDVPSDGAEAWLVTFGPGEIYWERFGHNAIWLREPAAGLDHTFNFGYFDFEQEDFFLRFIRGRMLYFSVAQPAEREFQFYRSQNRSIRLQKLELEPAQYLNLRDHLLYEIQPENRDYRYDYYLNNCSTRIRDAMDIALDGALSARTKPAAAKLNFRDQTRRLTQMQFWYYLGLELGLGHPVDRSISRWEEMFIPMVLADEMAAMSVALAEAGRALVTVDTLLYESTTPQVAAAPDPVWLRYLIFGLLVTAIVCLAAKFMPSVWVAIVCNSWVIGGSVTGILLACLWMFTDHEVARNNANLLLFNPLVILMLIPRFRKTGVLMMAGGVSVALLLFLLPEHQYNLDLLVLLAPINLAVAFYFSKK